MSKKKYRSKRRDQFPYLPVMTGVSLIGFAILAMAPSNSRGEAQSSGFKPAIVNYAVPELSLQNINGEMESLSDYRDTVVLVNNWATWCPPCKAEMPTLAAYYNKHTSEGFTIIAIEAGDAVEGVAKFASDYNLNFPVWLDPNGASVRAFGNSTLPNSFVIDRTGTVRYAWTGEVNMALLEEYVTPLLKE